MKKIYAIALFGILSASLLGCAPASPPPTSTPAPTDTPALTSTPEPTDTPVPTDTPTPTATPIPIPGIDEPIVVNEVSVQVLDAKWENPVVVTGFQLKEGYSSLLITFKLQSEKTNSPADLMNAIEFRDMRVVDDQGNESPVVFFNLPISSLTGGEYAQLGLYFAVLKNTTPQSIQFVDGQMIELTQLAPP